MTDEERRSDGSNQESVQGESAVREIPEQKDVYTKDWVRKIYLMMLTHPEVQTTDEYKPEFFLTRRPKRGMKEEYVKLLSGDHATESGFYEAQKILMDLGVISESKDSQLLRRKINRNIIVKPESERPGHIPPTKPSKKSSKREIKIPTPPPPPLPSPLPPEKDADGIGDGPPKPPTDEEKGEGDIGDGSSGPSLDKGKSKPDSGSEEGKEVRATDPGVGLESPREPRVEKEATGSSSLEESRDSFLSSGPPETLIGEMDFNLPEISDKLPEPPEESEHQPTTPIYLPQQRLPRAEVKLPNPSGPPTTIIIY